MKNGPIEKAIGEFKNRRLGVYEADPDQIVRDTRGAERATKDHVGRWLYELLQNSDDAQASEVRIIIDKDTIYVADNGHGFKPESVSAICGTDFSDKTTGTIGRKGVGFKAVYEVSQNPQMLTVNGEGIEFSREKTQEWLSMNGLNDGHVPYHWIPFFISWDDAQRRDPFLNEFKKNSFKTVVRLPGLSGDKKKEVEQLLLLEWPPYALFAFRHLRKITAPGLEVVLNAGDGIWSLSDSRKDFPEQWSVVRLTERPPAELLQSLPDEERQRISTDGVSFLIAAPLENDCVVPTSDYLPIHVFYPTEQNGPVRLLLHAEFLVKSDRTAILPVDSNPFNAWVADRLAYHVCNFVNDSYRPKAPSSYAALLVPFPDRTSHPVAENLWRRVANEAKQCLRLADIEGCQRLGLKEARLVSVRVRPDLARILLEATSVRGQLLHSSFDNDKEAHKALKELGCKEINDNVLMNTIAENAASLATNTQWVWTCWQWLAEWVAKEPYGGEEHRKRIERVSELPVVPVNGSLKKASDLTGRIVTWRPDIGVGNLPDWLPLTFVADWFRDRIQNKSEQESPVKKLSKELEVEEPGEDVVQRAVGQAIKQYWKDPQGDPERFLKFILKQNWHETSSRAREVLQRCPVPLTQPIQGKKWAEAGKAYFGREWKNNLLADLYAGIQSVAWVASDEGSNDTERRRQILEWLGVADRPRIVNEHENSFIWQLPDGCREWVKYLWTARDFDGRSVEKIKGVSGMEHLAVEDLPQGLGTLLIRLIAKQWDTYYREHAEVYAYGKLSREWYDRSWPVKAKWWWEVCERLVLPKRGESEGHAALAKLWLPDRQTEKAIGELLPVLDLDAFESDKDLVREWLKNTVRLRTQIDELTEEEWRAILSRHIPNNAPSEHLASEEKLRDKVTRWYVACLETVAEQEKVAAKVFVSCPLLCRKGNVWQYVSDGPRYLNDDNDLGTVFAEDVWLFHISERLHQYAVKYFGLVPLSQSVNITVTPDEPQSPLSGELNVRFKASLPYVWAWRSSQSREHGEKLSWLKALEVRVVSSLKADLSLGGLRREVERCSHVNGNTIYLHKDYANETHLAQALAKALDVRSEADFYENLFRCTDDHQRKEKLLSKGMADAEIDRCLREYAGPPADDEHDEALARGTKGGAGGSTSQKPSGGGIDGDKPKQSPTVPSPEISNERTQSVPLEISKQPLRVKDPHTTNYVLGSPPTSGAGTGGSGTGGGTECEGRSLTDAEKAELEGAGIAFAIRVLEGMGFSAKKMPQGNPGFDLLAKKDGDELRVEVKAHSGRATVVEVTQREYKEYLGQQGYRWELWNVEHLAEDDSHQVVITRYDQIPDDALDARTFRVDLKKCQRKLQD